MAGGRELPEGGARADLVAAVTTSSGVVPADGEEEEAAAAGAAEEGDRSQPPAEGARQNGGERGEGVANVEARGVDGVGHAARLARKRLADHRVGCGRAEGLGDPESRSRRDQLRIVGCEGLQYGSDGPASRGDEEDGAAGEAVAHHAGGERGHRVERGECIRG
eukprot:scaffold20310_cov125-Isochrysis_galbana.AAC.18